MSTCSPPGPAGALSLHLLPSRANYQLTSAAHCCPADAPPIHLLNDRKSGENSDEVGRLLGMRADPSPHPHPWPRTVSSGCFYLREGGWAGAGARLCGSLWSVPSYHFPSGTLISAGKESSKVSLNREPFPKGSDLRLSFQGTGKGIW